MKQKLILIFFLSLSGFIDAQVEKVVNRQAQFWTSINSTHRLSNHWGVVGDFHIRRTEFLKDPSFYFLRVGGAYWLNDEFSFTTGLAGLWLATDHSQGRSFAFEKRIYQQIIWRAAFDRTVFVQRVRNEQRWHDVLDYETGEVDRTRFSNRIRFLLSANFKVFKNDKFPKLVISDEILFHFGEEVIYNTFDQNRIFLGINYKFKPEWSLDFGYMLVLQQRYAGNVYDQNHTLRLFFYYTPDFRKKADTDLPHYNLGGEE